MLGKIIDGVLITPSENEKKKIIISNPTNEQLKLIMGYKDLIIDDEPEVDEGQYLEPVYKETETTIFKHWEIKDVEQNEALPEEAINPDVILEESEQGEDLSVGADK